MALTRLPQRKRGAQIDLSLAIVNIVLLLILFFLIAGQLVSAQRLRVDPARTQSLAISQLPSPVLTQTAPGKWELDGDVLSLSALDRRLAEVTDLYVVAERGAAALDIIELSLRPGLSHLTLHLATVRHGTDP